MHQPDNEFEVLVSRYRQTLLRVAYHLCGDREAAQDIVQETLLDAYTAFADLREPDKAAAWLYAILRRKAARHLHKHRPEVELDDQIPSPGEAESVVRQIVIEQMAKLNHEDREILAGKYLLGLSYRELAESLGISEGNVRVRSLRAKQRLGDILRGVGVEVPEKRR